MIISESAGVAATVAVKENLTVQDVVSIAPVQQRLQTRRQRLWLKDLGDHQK